MTDVKEKLPEIGETWTDFSGVPHHVTHATAHSVTANTKGRSVNLRIGAWLEEMTPLDIDDALKELDRRL